jgi:hypothetical protein
MWEGLDNRWLLAAGELRVVSGWAVLLFADYHASSLPAGLPPWLGGLLGVHRRHPWLHLVTLGLWVRTRASTCWGVPLALS